MLAPINEWAGLGGRLVRKPSATGCEIGGPKSARVLGSALCGSTRRIVRGGARQRLRRSTPRSPPKAVSSELTNIWRRLSERLFDNSLDSWRLRKVSGIVDGLPAGRRVADISLPLAGPQPMRG